MNWSDSFLSTPSDAEHLSEFGFLSSVSLSSTSSLTLNCFAVAACAQTVGVAPASTRPRYTPRVARTRIEFWFLPLFKTLFLCRVSGFCRYAACCFSRLRLSFLFNKHSPDHLLNWLFRRRKPDDKFLSVCSYLSIFQQLIIIF